MVKDKNEWADCVNPLLGFPNADGTFGVKMTLHGHRDVTLGFGSEADALAFAKDKGFDNFTIEAVTD